MARSSTVGEDLVTRREAAQLAGVHINTVRLWESTGRLSTTKAANGIVMIPRKEIEDIIESRKSEARTDGERAAALDAENRVLREQLTELNTRYEHLLDQVLRLAGENR